MDTMMRLESLEEGGAVVADPMEDLRGTVLFDAHGHRLGEAADQIVDAAAGVTCYVVVESSGLLGMLSVRRLIPVEVLERVGPSIRVLRSAELVRQSAPIAPRGWADPQVVKQVRHHYQVLDLDPVEVEKAREGAA